MVEQLKKLIKKYFAHFTYFYVHLRHRIFVALGISVLVGLLDGFGLAMFFPLLEMVSGSESVSGDGLGGLDFLITGFTSIGVEINLVSVLIIIASFFVLKGIAKFVEQYYNVVTQQYFIRKLRYESVDKLGKMKYKKFVMSDVGRIQNTLSGEVGRVSQAYRSYFQAVQALVLVIVYIALAVVADPQFAILVVIGGGLSNFVYNRIYKKTKETSKNITTGGHEFQGLLIQFVAFYKYFKATGLIDSYSQKLKSAIDYIEHNTKKIGLYASILTATREPLVITVVILVIIVQVSFFSQSVGAIILSLMFFYRSLNSLMQMQTHWNGFLNMSGALSNTTSFLQELVANQEPQGKEVLSAFNKSLSVESVFFSYADSKAILKNLTLTISKNETVAFVGPSGSGKTTLVNLLAGLMPIETGHFFIDDRSISTLNRKSYQQRIGYITQEPVIFSDTIYNNVTFWDKDTPQNRDRFWRALQLASLEDFVHELPKQENALLGNNGVLVSGGQKQRLSIARELYKNVDILIMDEATSALDSETERIIQDNIEALKGKYTILIVAHRLSTVKQADKIVVLDKGEIVATGDYHTLIDESDVFKRMVSLQEI